VVTVHRISFVIGLSTYLAYSESASSADLRHSGTTYRWNYENRKWLPKPMTSYEEA
jgi:hypothetical protein